MFQYKTINKIKLYNLLKYKKDYKFVKNYGLHMFNENRYVDNYDATHLTYIINNQSLNNTKREIQNNFSSIHNKFNTIYKNKFNSNIINSYYENILSIYLLIDYYNKELIYIDNNNMNIIINNSIMKLKLLSLLNIDEILIINNNISSGFYSLNKYIDYIIYESLKNSINALLYKNNPILQLNINEDANNIIINIYDNGIGIKDTNKIYNYTYSTNDKNNLSLSGYGLGLSFSKFFIEFLNGSININSVYNNYTFITIIIPKNITI
jgi:light-regulated signal transduction histidine kinase (bacteriophytochrome)